VTAAEDCPAAAADRSNIGAVSANRRHRPAARDLNAPALRIEHAARELRDRILGTQIIPLAFSVSKALTEPLRDIRVANMCASVS